MTMKNTPERVLSLGKLNFRLLERLLKVYQRKKDKKVIIGPKFGEDASVINFGKQYLVATIDPITFITDEIGWYAVQVNANDIASMGAIPKWFLSTILLPEKIASKDLVEKIFAQIDKACRKINVTVIGGHTEITRQLDRPIVIGCMLGEVKKEKLVSSSGAKVGDLIILTKGIVIEGTSIIAREKEKELRKKGYPEIFIKRCKNFLYNPGISVLKEALLANQFYLHAMHDPTEGGLAAALYELAQASKIGILIEKEKIPILKESKILCEEYNLDPLRTISSGSLLIVTSKRETEKIVCFLEKNKIKASIIGEIREKNFGIKIKEMGKMKSLRVSSKDEITKNF